MPRPFRQGDVIRPLFEHSYGKIVLLDGVLDRHGQRAVAKSERLPLRHDLPNGAYSGSPPLRNTAVFVPAVKHQPLVARLLVLLFVLA